MELARRCGLKSAEPRVSMTPLASSPAPRGNQEASLGRIFVVDDEPLLCRAVARALDAAGFTARTFDAADAVAAALEENPAAADVLITDVFMPGKTGFDLLTEVHARYPNIPIVLMTGQATVTAAVEAIRLGAYDYLVKPIDAKNTLIPAVRRALQHRRLVERNRFLERQLDASSRVQGLVGESAQIRNVCSIISAAAASDVTVLVLGESGTGKELVARAIHEQSPRSGQSFVDINCAALTDSLLESELFGHVRGAFTGATSARRGLFETANGGTLFLDEVGELSATTQARLLRVLQEGMVRPVGSSESKAVDVRIIAATNRNLAQEVRVGRFRQDLFYRLNVLTVEMPPLRERFGDIPLLVEHFLTKHSARLRRPKPRVDPRVLDALSQFDWPGNVRELENTIERTLVLSRDDLIGPDVLPPGFHAPSTPEPPRTGPTELLPMTVARDRFVRSYARRLLTAAGGNVNEAARIAGMDASNFRRLLKRIDAVNTTDAD